jgi:undecaprenyl pyrophosphate phosphatase UppP
MHYFRVPKLRSIHSTPLDPKCCLGVFQSISLIFGMSNDSKLVSGLNALIQGIEVAKHPLYSIRPKMMFGSVSEHFANLRHLKRCKTCVLGMYALFHGTEVAKHPFYSILPKMMSGSVSEHFANIRHVKRCKTCVSGLYALF